MTIVGVAEANVPNRERIIFRPTQIVQLTEFAVLIGLKNYDGSLIPQWDSMYWFGAATVTPPSWICLYTGTGTPSVTKEGEEYVHNYYWNRTKTVFHSNNLNPLLIRIGGVIAGNLLQPPAPNPSQKLLSYDKKGG